VLLILTKKNYNPTSSMDLYGKVVENVNRINEKKQSAPSGSSGSTTSSGPAMKSDELMNMF